MEKVKSKSKIKLMRDGKVWVDESEVGYVVTEIDRNQTKQQILDYFSKDDPKFAELVSKLRFPKEFTFIWVSKLYVKQSQRSQGYGAKILKQLRQKFKNKNLVIGLSPGLLVKTTNLSRLLPFYKKQGFKLVDSGVAHYGFNVRRKIQSK
jgi:GNAT superfamily N-acetyltransferase